jgi:hypothetical protein
MSIVRSSKRAAARYALAGCAALMGLVAGAAVHAWDGFDGPATGTAEVIGTYSAGCVIGAEALASDGAGWQDGDVPAPPDGLMEASREAWVTWMSSWFAAHWTREDLPGLRQVIRLYDQVERGEFQRASELRLQMDTYGITPKGQQDRRWKRPADGGSGSKE